MAKVYGTFFGGEATLLQSSVFKIYVTDDRLHFARVADRFYQELMESGSTPPGVGGALMQQGVMQPAVRKRQESVARYDALEPGSPEFLGLEKRNFSVRPSEVLKASLSKVTTMTQGPGRVGFLELQLSNGKKRRFTLTSPLPAIEVEKLVRIAVPAAEGSLS